MASTSTSFNAILNVTQNVEPFLTTKDTVAVTWTCKLRYCVKQLSMQRQEDHVIRSLITVHHTSLPFASNEIHFPSLRRIQLPFRYDGLIQHTSTIVLVLIPCWESTTCEESPKFDSRETYSFLFGLNRTCD